MFNKLFFLAILVIISYGLFRGWSSYENYKLEKAARIQRLQAQAEEVKVTTIEGWTIEDIASQLDKVGLVSPQQFKSTVKKFDYSEYPLIQKPEDTSLEGYLFPDTYRFAKNATVDVIVAKMLDNFSSRVKSLGVQKLNEDIVIPGYENLDVSGGDRKAGNSLYDILILASIIEKESGGKGTSQTKITLEEERKLIAGVFYNRLLIGQALESDATVNYATGKSVPGASYKDLGINSPYNSYKYPGLPPGPVSNPSLGSIEAALNPIKSDYYFFLHKQPSGEVMFSKTFEEHKK